MNPIAEQLFTRDLDAIVAGVAPLFSTFVQWVGTAVVLVVLIAAAVAVMGAVRRLRDAADAGARARAPSLRNRLADASPVIRLSPLRPGQTIHTIRRTWPN